MIETLEKRCEICSVLTIKTSFVNFEQMLAGYSLKHLWTCVYVIFQNEETCSTYMCHMSFDNSSSSMIHTFLLCNSATFPTWDNVFRCCPKWNKTMGIFRMFSKIYDEAFSRRRRLLESSIINVWHGPEAVVQRCSVK